MKFANNTGGGKQTGTNYFIAAPGSGGNDSNSGLDSSHPVTTTKIASLSLNNGDTLNFNQGDTFVIGDISQSVTALNIYGYGSGAAPKIYGSTSVSGATWTSVGGGVWSTVLGSAPLWVYVNGSSIAVGRSPLVTIASVATNVITLTSVAPINGYGGSFIGAKLRGLANTWIVGDEYTVTGYNSGAKTITVDRTIVKMSGGYCWMYQQQQFLAASTWYYDGVNTLYVQTASGATPAGTDIRVGTYNTFILNKMQINMNNIELLNFHTNPISYQSWSLIQNNTIHNCRGNAMFGWYADHSRILNNTIYNCDLNGIFSFNGSYTYYLSNTIYNIALGATIGFPTGSDALEAGTGTYPTSVTGLEFEGYGLTSMQETSSQIIHNTVYNQGYVGIHLASSNLCLVDRNYVHDYISRIDDGIHTLSDGGGIYSEGALTKTNGFSTISNNIVMNGGNTKAGGIYIDNYSQSMIVTGNSIFNGGGVNGMLINSGTKNTTVTNNKMITEFATEGGICFTEVGGFPWSNAGCTVTGNESAMLNAYGCIEVKTAFNPFSGGSCDFNKYVYPYAASNTAKRNSIFYNLASWQPILSVDASSTERTNYIVYSNSSNANHEVMMQTNPSDTPMSFNVPAGYSDANGNSFSNPVTIAAYSSLIYYKNTSYP